LNMPSLIWTCIKRVAARGTCHLRGCLWLQIRAALLCNTRQLRPRTHVKTEDDSMSSDEERRVAPSYDSLNETARAVPGEQQQRMNKNLHVSHEASFPCCLSRIGCMFHFVLGEARSLSIGSVLCADSASALNRIECLQRYRDKKQRRHFSHKVRICLGPPEQSARATVLHIRCREWGASLLIQSPTELLHDLIYQLCSAGSLHCAQVECGQASARKGPLCEGLRLGIGGARGAVRSLGRRRERSCFEQEES